MNTKTEDKLESAMSQAKAQFDSIAEMVEALRDVDKALEDTESDALIEAREDAECTIQQDALCVEVRSAWYTPGAAEYTILLCTGGPAVRIIGKLDEWFEPETACLECRDWFLPWTAWTGNCSATADVLMAYARCFYFGE